MFTGEINQTTQYNVLAHDPQTGCETVMSVRPVVTIVQPPSGDLLYPDLFSWAKPGAYMYDVIIERKQGQKLLRFSVASTNKGAGPFELRATVESDGTTTATQRIYDDQGGYIDREAGIFVFADHADHNHFHFADFANYRLHEVINSNEVGPVVRASDKVTFAMFDITPYDLSLPGAPATEVYHNPQSSLDPQGISVGWADVYHRGLSGQVIDIAGVTDGEYWLEVTIDPSNRLAESDETNNTTYVKVILKGNRATSNSDQPAGASSAARAAADFQTSEAGEGLEKISLFPNPGNGEFNVVIEDKYVGPYSLRIHDFSGRALQDQTLQKEGRIATTRIDMSQAPKGIYLLSIYHNGIVTNRKIMITD